MADKANMPSCSNIVLRNNSNSPSISTPE